MSKTSLAKQGYAVGAPEVLAPERVRGQGPSRQSDLYSLGIICYQMLCGSPPFTGTPASVLHAQAYEQPQPLHVVNPGVSVPLSEAVGRMLSKGLELRYITGSEFVRALTVAVEGTAPVRRPAAARIQPNIGREPLSSFWRRPWVWAAATIPIVLLLLVIGFLAVSGWATLRPTIIDTSSEETEPVSGAAPSATAQASEIQAGATEPAVTLTPTELPNPTSTTASSPTPIPPTPTNTPTFVPIPTPGPPTVIEGSPFTNLVLAHAISEDNEPEKVGTSFAPGSSPIYLFFDYADIEPGTTWSHRWVWGDIELGVYDDVWPDNYFETGTAWVFYTPVGGYQPGPYQVTIEIEGSTVATATFVIEAGGL
jgi:serine/threonine protein kinase